VKKTGVLIYEDFYHLEDITLVLQKITRKLRGRKIKAWILRTAIPGVANPLNPPYTLVCEMRK